METPHLLGLLSLFSGILLHHPVSSWSIEMPTVVTALEGSCVEVPCQTQPHHRVIWYRYDNIRYPTVYDGHSLSSVESQFRDRTSVLGNAAEGNCTLRINHVKRADSGLKIYVWINPEEKTSQKFHHQTVTIRLIARKAPIISIQKEIVDDGEVFQANCSILHTCPSSPPSLHWNISPFPENSSLMNFTEEVNGQWLYTEKLQGLATYKLHQSKITCTAQFSTFTTESKPITLSVLYKPVNVTLTMQKESVMEGDNVMMKCVADCYPQPYLYSWLRRHKGQTKQEDSTQGKMSFLQVMRDTSVSCIALNYIGAGQSDWMHLDVHYAPVILSDSACHLIGETLRCVCKAQASPTASISWTINGNDTLPFSVSKKKKNIVSVEMSGTAQGRPNVSCTARNSRGSDTKHVPVLPIETQTNTFLPWLLAVFVSALMLGCMILVYRRYLSRPQLSVDTPNTEIPLSLRNLSGNDQQQERYEIPQRLQDERTQATTCSPETKNLMKTEADRNSTIYEIDNVETAPKSAAAQHYQNNPAILQTPPKMQQKQQQTDCNMDDTYLNC